jgi:hypothetical protein
MKRFLVHLNLLTLETNIARVLRDRLKNPTFVGQTALFGGFEIRGCGFAGTAIPSAHIKSFGLT